MGVLIIVSALILGSLVESESPLPRFVVPSGYPGHPAFVPARQTLELQITPERHIQPPPPSMTCIMTCVATEEYAPICVTIGGRQETFPNRGSAACAERCRGQPMTDARSGPCPVPQLRAQPQLITFDLQVEPQQLQRGQVNPELYLSPPQLQVIERHIPPPPPGLTCTQSCTITREYMPICVTIGGRQETFSNHGAAMCAERCRGLPMTDAKPGRCSGPQLWDRRNLAPGAFD